MNMAYLDVAEFDLYMYNFILLRFTQSFSPVLKKEFPKGIGPVIRIALFGIGRAGNSITSN